MERHLLFNSCLLLLPWVLMLFISIIFTYAPVPHPKSVIESMSFSFKICIVYYMYTCTHGMNGLTHHCIGLYVSCYVDSLNVLSPFRWSIRIGVANRNWRSFQNGAGFLLLLGYKILWIAYNIYWTFSQLNVRPLVPQQDCSLFYWVFCAIFIAPFWVNCSELWESIVFLFSMPVPLCLSPNSPVTAHPHI